MAPCYRGVAAASARRGHASPAVLRRRFTLEKSMSTALTRYQSTYVAKQALFSLFGNTFRLFNADGSLGFYVKKKSFKLKEDIIIYADEGEKEPMLRIKARSIMDISATYDITDAVTGESLGAMRRKGLKSILRDEWSVLGAGDAEVGTLIEDSGFLSLLRRFFPIIPQSFKVSLGGTEVGILHQRFSFFGLVYDIDFSRDSGGLVDRRLIVAMTVLILAIEGRQR
jgi:uncharacterized protein YxjI